MKYLALTFSLITALLFSSCETEGPQGPQGPPGFDGRDGAELLTQIYEIADVDFNENNNFSHFEVFADATDLEILDTDLVLVYRQNGVDPNSGDVWQLLPQNFFLDQGILQYNFNHTLNDVEIILDSDNNFDLTTINATDSANFLEGQIFRIAIIPAEIAPDPNTAAKVIGGFNPLSYETIAKDAVFIN